MKVIVCLVLCLVSQLLALPMSRHREISQKQVDSFYALVQMQGSCRSAGFTNGCCTADTCFVESGPCFCDERCYSERNCCNDIALIGCYPTTCSGLGLNPGCCNQLPVYNCRVPYGRCYCDSACHRFNDCCRDVVDAPCPSQANRLSNTQGEFSRIPNNQLKQQRLNDYYVHQILEHKKMDKITDRMKFLNLIGVN